MRSSQGSILFTSALLVLLCFHNALCSWKIYGLNSFIPTAFKPSRVSVIVLSNIIVEILSVEPMIINYEE